MKIELLLGGEHSCSYLPGRNARSLYVDPASRLNVPLYSFLAELGFRRSGDLVYRPQCRDCVACVPVRLPVGRFSPNRSQLRIMRRNVDLAVIRKSAGFAEEHYRLFRRYLAARHDDGGMADSSPQEFIGFLGSRWADVWFVEFRHEKALLAVAVVDRLDRGLSAVYTFFDPDHAERGLGVFAVLWQISEAKRLGLDWLYLGFWVEDCRKMSYKERYRPLEALIGGYWRVFEKGEKIRF